MTPAEIAVLITALGFGGILTKLFDRGWGAITGRAKERRSEVDRAWARADDEARKRRVIEEHASRLTRRLIEAPCVDDRTIEPFPTYKE